MVKTFNSAREVFRYYFPNYMRREERKEVERLGPYKQEQKQGQINKLVEELLEDFKLSLEG